MRFLTAAIAVGLFSASTVPVGACSIRGQFCSYPAWAANAFEHPRNRVNLDASPILPSAEYREYRERPRYHARRVHHRRYKR